MGLWTHLASPLSAYDSALADLVSSGNAELAARFLADAGVNAGEAASKLPLYAEALKRVDNDSKLATTSQEGMARATAQTTQEAEKAADAIRKQASAALELVAAQLSASNSAIAYQQSSASVADIIAKIQQGTEGMPRRSTSQPRPAAGISLPSTILRLRRYESPRTTSRRARRQIP